MTNDAPPIDAAIARPPPLFTAPPLVVIMALILIGLYAAFFFTPVNDQSAILYDFALAPERFWAPAGSPDVYPDVASGLVTLLSTALLHGDWLHVLINSLMLLSFGTPVARALGNTAKGWGFWMLLFVVSIVAGSALYLALATVDSAWAIGASGGTSGLIAAAFLLDPRGGKRKLWSREFLTITAILVIANALLTFAAPYLLRTGLAWEAHAGGYIAGALLMAVLPIKGYERA